MSKQSIDLSLVLPEDADACDACIGRLVGALEAKPGIERAHVRRAEDGTAELCLHYDPETVRLDALRSLAKSAGAEAHGRFAHISVPVNGLRHERQAKLVEAAIARVEGVLFTSVSFGSERLYVELDPARTTEAEVLRIAREAGVLPKAKHQDRDHGHGHGAGENAHGHGHDGPFGERSELYFSLGCGALTLIGWILGRAGSPAAVITAVFVLAYVLGGWFTLREIVVALRARRFEIDFLMLLAAIGAAVLGEWFEGALLLFLFTLGHSLEGFAMGRARQAIAALSALVPDTAVRVDEAGEEHEVPVDDLRIRDRIIVKPNTRIPADGLVAEGASAVNQAPITGESVPVDKRPSPDLERAILEPDKLSAQHRVFAGTINGPAALAVVVTKIASESTLARVAKMVAEAETQRSPTQVLTDHFERVFVPVILAVVVALLFAGFFIDEPFSASFYRAMAVLVAASPCALAIATPSAVLSGVARAARAGVLIKGGAHLEALGSVDAVAFDKTGTLTEGKPRLTDVVPCAGVEESALLRVALAVESRSDHPLAHAIVEGAGARLGETPRASASEVEAIVGYGVRAVVEGERVRIGKPGLFEDMPEPVRRAADDLANAGRTLMVVHAGERYLGVLGVMDTPRASAAPVVNALHTLGVTRTIMLSGDDQRVANAVAAQVGIREARGNLLPDEKVDVIRALGQSYGPVAMVGDGVNDAPALAHATVGIAMGAGGSDVALEAADVALMADDLSALPFAVGLSRASRRIIRQNLWASLGMVAFLVPATIFGFAGIGVAVALHEGSTLLVVINALRLLAYAAATPRNVPT